MQDLAPFRVVFSEDPRRRRSNLLHF